jgi:hypothetical protein
VTELSSKRVREARIKKLVEPQAEMEIKRTRRLLIAVL